MHLWHVSILCACEMFKFQFLGQTLSCKLKGRPFVVVVVCRPSVCLSVYHGCIVAKRCKIGPRLLLITNSKLHTGFQMTYKSLTLDDLEGCYAFFFDGKLAISRKRWEIRPRLLLIPFFLFLNFINFFCTTFYVYFDVFLYVYCMFDFIINK